MGEADVYAGDLDLLRGRSEVAGNFKILIQADGYPDVLARIANVLLLTNSAPNGVHLQTEVSGLITIRVVITDTVPDVIRRVATKLRQLIMVREVSVESLAESIDP
jgi:hypothetical protein